MTLLLVIIILSLLFDYINGFHDAANSIATIVATKVLTPFQAVLWAAFFNWPLGRSSSSLGKFSQPGNVFKSSTSEMSYRKVVE